MMNRDDLAIHDDSTTIARIHGVQNCISTNINTALYKCTKVTRTCQLRNIFISHITYEYLLLTDSVSWVTWIGLDCVVYYVPANTV